MLTVWRLGQYEGKLEVPRMPDLLEQLTTRPGSYRMRLVSSPAATWLITAS